MGHAAVTFSPYKLIRILSVLVMYLPLEMGEGVSSFGLTLEGGGPVFLSNLVDVHVAAFYLSLVSSSALELGQYLGAFWIGAEGRGKEMPGPYLQGVSVWIGTQDKPAWKSTRPGSGGSGTDAARRRSWGLGCRQHDPTLSVLSKSMSFPKGYCRPTERKGWGLEDQGQSTD